MFNNSLSNKMKFGKKPEGDFVKVNNNNDKEIIEDNYLIMVESKPRTMTHVRKFKKPEFKLDK